MSFKLLICNCSIFIQGRYDRRGAAQAIIIRPRRMFLQLAAPRLLYLLWVHYAARIENKFLFPLDPIM